MQMIISEEEKTSHRDRETYLLKAANQVTKSDQQKQQSFKLLKKSIAGEVAKRTEMEVTVKAFLQKTESSVEVRRIPLSLELQGKNSNAFQKLVMKVGEAFPDLANQRFSLKWKDVDGDYILMSTDGEVLEAATEAQGSPLKIYVAMEGPMETASEDFTFVQPESDVDRTMTGDDTGETTHNKEYPFAGGPPFMGPAGFPFFPHAFGPAGPFGVPHPPPPPPFGMGIGGHGHSMGCKPFGRHGHHGHGPHRHGLYGHGPHGHGPFGGAGPFGRKYCSWGGHGPFGGHFRGVHPPHPFFHGMHGGPHHGGPHQGGQRHAENGGKAALRDAVPVAHRRWAKVYIRNWRVQNIQNATTTSSESDQEQFTIDSATVPEAYAKWLDLLLLKWHKHWGKNKKNDDGEKSSDESDKEERKELKELKKKLKQSVPKEFRKWAKWYLTRRFGQKEAPKLKGKDVHQGAWYGRNGCHSVDSQEKEIMGKYHADKACKAEEIKAYVPVTQRVWTRNFISEWRKQNNIAEAVPAIGGATSDSEDTERKITKGADISVPADYARWLQKFLPRWHMWRGQMEKSKEGITIGGMGEFKATVPMHYRCWVKHYMRRRYDNSGRQCGAIANSANQYQKWFRAFQQKWLNDKQQGSDNEGLYLTSSDDEMAGGPFTSDNDTDQEVDSSMKKLHLMEGSDSESPAGRKGVRFNPSIEGWGQRKAMKKMMKARMMRGMDSGGNDSGTWKKVNPGFRQWAKEAMNQWDGHTVNSETAQSSMETGEQGTTTTSDEHIPPHVYRWMCKFMAKRQMRHMKREMKQAKHAWKVAKKTHK